MKDRYPRTLEQAFGPYTSRRFDREPASLVQLIVNLIARLFR
jgi:hypothetical protein